MEMKIKELREQLKEIDKYKKQLLDTLDELRYQLNFALELYDLLAVATDDLEGTIQEMESLGGIYEENKW